MKKWDFCTKLLLIQWPLKRIIPTCGIRATEFYMFIDILDDLVDDHSASFSQKATYLEKHELS